ncbi:MAG: hypothetical protein ACYS9Y_10880 [Planctomycetota bacterium]|jgi:hypothetical protein
MKKLMILVLVIGMASLANATLSLDISVGGNPYTGQLLAVGTTVDVKVVQDAPNPTGQGGEMTVTMYASGGTATDTTPQLNVTFAGWDWILNGGAAYYDNLDGTWSAWFGKTSRQTSGYGMPGTPGIGSWVGLAPHGGWPYESTIEFSFVTTVTTDLVWGGYPHTWDGVTMDGVVGGTVNVGPEPSTPPVAVDIKPGSCPNPVNVKSKGVLPVAILGSESFDVTSIDVASIRLADVAPIRSSYEDAATPVSNGNDCECTTAGSDGYLDLVLKFESQAIIEALGEVEDGDEWILELTGTLYDEREIAGEDCIIIRAKSKAKSK